jgi:hypothetical protein
LVILTYLIYRFLAYKTLDLQQAKKYAKAPKPGAGTSPLVKQHQVANPPKRQRTAEDSRDQPGPSSSGTLEKYRKI